MESVDSKLIMIIDDNPLNLMIASKSLENFGFRTITAESGAEGIDKLKEEKPSLILLDIMMPEMDGYEVCRMIKNMDSFKDVPVIFLTANSHTENLVEGFNAGGVDYMVKPFKADELLVRINNHIELAESKRTILEMVRSRDKLYSIIAHDIRSPLSGILQTIDAIDQGYFDPTSEDFKDIIHHLRIRTHETSTLLTSLLQWTRLQANNMTMDFNEVDLNQIVMSCVQLLSANAGDKEISIKTEFAEQAIAWCDEVSVHTIIRNLLSNAIKFTPTNGTITVSTATVDAFSIISVSDSGVGMSEETISKIFYKNVHHTSSGTANEQGTGLGLMLVKDFVNRNNGDIHVKSTEGVGTTITVKLPVNK